MFCEYKNPFFGFITITGYFDDLIFSWSVSNFLFFLLLLKKLDNKFPENSISLIFVFFSIVCVFFLLNKNICSLIFILLQPNFLMNFDNKDYTKFPITINKSDLFLSSLNETR